MDIDEAKRRGSEAAALYRQQRYDEALTMLDALEPPHSGYRDVVFTRGRCLAKLGRFDEAYRMFASLQAKHGQGPWTGRIERLAAAGHRGQSETEGYAGKAPEAERTSANEPGRAVQTPPLTRVAQAAKTPDILVETLNSLAPPQCEHKPDGAGSVLDSSLVQTALGMLGAAKDLETVLSETYEAAGEVWREDREFWRTLASQKRLHATYADVLAGLVARSPMSFSVNRPLNSEPIARSAEFTRRLTGRLSSADPSKSDLLGSVLEVERSIVENHHYDFLTTNLTEYERILDTVLSQTREHATTIAKRIPGTD